MWDQLKIQGYREEIAGIERKIKEEPFSLKRGPRKTRLAYVKHLLNCALKGEGNPKAELRKARKVTRKRHSLGRKR